MSSVSIQLVDMNASALCLLARGELTEAKALFQRVIATGDEWHVVPVVYAHVLLGGLYLDQLRLELADRLTAGLHLIRIHGLMAELARARRDPEKAFLEIERSIAAGGPEYFGTEARYSRATLAQFWMPQGKLNLARSWAAELDLDLDRTPEFSHVAEYLVLGELLAREGGIR